MECHIDMHGLPWCFFSLPGAINDIPGSYYYTSGTRSCSMRSPGEGISLRASLRTCRSSSYLESEYHEAFFSPPGFLPSVRSTVHARHSMMSLTWLCCSKYAWLVSRGRIVRQALTALRRATRDRRWPTRSHIMPSGN